MEVVPLYEVRWNEVEGEYVNTGCLIGYECRGTSGNVLGRGESIGEAVEVALKAMWAPQEPGNA